MANHSLPTQLQPNIVTAARYEYTLWEKRIIYQVLAQINKDIKSGVNEVDLFNNRVIRMPLKQVISGDKERLKEAKKAVISLRMKSFEIISNAGTPQECWEESGFIYRSKITDGMVEVVVSELLMPYLIDLTKAFTRYSPFTAMILRSTYSQRFYEFCCRFRDTGHWHVSIEELREMLKIDDKYGTYGELKKNVIDKAKARGEQLRERLRELSDRYEQIGEVRGRGLLVGIELVLDRDSTRPAEDLTRRITADALERGLSVNVARAGATANCIRMAPPLTIGESEIDLGVDILEASLRAAVAAG